jgi:hypothetical protein
MDLLFEAKRPMSRIGLVGNTITSVEPGLPATRVSRYSPVASARRCSLSRIISVKPATGRISKG